MNYYSSIDVYLNKQIFRYEIVDLFIGSAARIVQLSIDSYNYQTE